MEDPRPDVELHIEDIRQILERFGFEVTQENIDAIIRNKTWAFAAEIRVVLQGIAHPEMEEHLRRVIEGYISN